jgi:Tfp pilus assembly protein PilN
MAIDRINLIPQEDLKGTGLSVSGGAVKWAGTAVVTLLVALSVVQQVQLKKKTETFSKLTAENEAVTRTLASLTSQVTSMDKTAQQMQAAQQFLQARVVWTDLFKELSLIVPRGVWLTQFSNTVKEGQSRVILIGEAPSQEKVAEFLGALESSYFFKNTNLQASEKLLGYAPSLFRFSVESTITQFKVREEKKIEPAK